jgi:hypothetical protein
LTAIAESAAAALVCTRTRLKSCPNLGSMNERVALSNGRPDERNTSWTTGGAVSGTEASISRR